MALANKRIGAPILVSIGRRGERPDLYPGRIVSQPQMAVVNSRPGEFATVITVQTNLDGDEYLAERVHNLAFAFDRSERIPLLDGVPTQPKTWQELVAEKAKATLEFMQSRPESVGSMDLADVAEL